MSMFLDKVVSSFMTPAEKMAKTYSLPEIYFFFIVMFVSGGATILISIKEIVQTELPGFIQYLGVAIILVVSAALSIYGILVWVFAWIYTNDK